MVILPTCSESSQLCPENTAITDPAKEYGSGEVVKEKRKGCFLYLKATRFL